MESGLYTIKIEGDGLEIDWLVSQEICRRIINVALIAASELEEIIVKPTA